MTEPSNAWRIALIDLFGEEDFDELLDLNPEPPAFRAAVEAEKREVVEMLAEAQRERDAFHGALQDTLANGSFYKESDVDRLMADRDAAKAEAERLREGLSIASCDVWAGRCRQIDVEGWTAEHDDAHANGEMARAAACYALWDAGSRVPHATTPADWPWNDKWWKPKDRRANLVRAGALIAAEIDRLDRMEALK